MSEILALIPARSGSKSVPHKNIRPFAGKPLLAWSIEQAGAARLVGRTMVSTDSPDYAEIARVHGAEVPFLRPAAISGDLATDLEVFQHALRWLAEHEGYRPEICLHLRPTSPIRDPGDIDRALEMLVADPTLDSVRSVSPAPVTPFKMWLVRPDGLLAPVANAGVPEAYNLPRQQLPPVFVQNACIDAVRSRVILEDGSMTGGRIAGFVMPEFDDIDTEEDFERAAARQLAATGTRGLTFCFDIDGVIASITPGNRYELAQPLAQNIEIVNGLHALGNRIVLFTARGSATGIDWTEITRRQMSEWGVRHDELRFGKPPADYYVDDRMLALRDARCLAGGNDRHEREAGGQR